MSMHQWMIEVTPVICHRGYVGDVSLSIKNYFVIYFKSAHFEEATFFRNPFFYTSVCNDVYPISSCSLTLLTLCHPIMHCWMHQASDCMTL